MSAHRQRAVSWTSTGNPYVPFEAEVDGETWTLRMNDFPDEPLYTLFVAEREIESFDDFPPAWSKPSIIAQLGRRLSAVLGGSARRTPEPKPLATPVIAPWFWPRDISGLIVRYRYGNEHSPTDPLGRVELELGLDRARADNWGRQLGGHHAWQGRPDPSTLQAVVDALLAAGFPRAVTTASGGAVPGTIFRSVTVAEGTREAATHLAWDDAAKDATYATVFDLLDAIVGQLSGGAIVHARTRRDDVYRTAEPPLVHDVAAIALAPEIDPMQQHLAAVRWHKQHTVRAEGGEYQLLCAVCGVVAMRFRRGVPEETFHGTIGSDRTISCTGITGALSFSDDNPRAFLDHLEAGAIPNAHSYMKRSYEATGLDAYCPECDRIYCAEHYSASDVFDESFYDYTTGTCPKGHRRMIAD